MHFTSGIVHDSTMVNNLLRGLPNVVKIPWQRGTWVVIPHDF